MEVLTQTMEVLVWTAELTRPQLCASALALLTALCVRHGTYTVLRVPLLLLVSGLITLDLLLYGAVRIAVKLVERVWVVGYKRRDQSMRRSTYAEWLEVGAALDKLEGLDQWKLEPESRAYNWRQVQTVTRRLRGAREAAQAAPPSRSREAICELESLLLPTLVKNYAGVGSAELYSKTHVGTKACVEAYVDEVCASLEAVRAYAASSPPAAAETVPFWRQAQISFGNSALLLSGGAMMGIYHYGVLRALVGRRALPRVVCGTSAGAVVAAFLAVRTDEEVAAELSCLDGLYREQGSDGPLHGSHAWKLRKLLTDGVLYSLEDFKAHLGWFTRGLSFREAFERTGRVVSITCTPHKRESASSPPLILNHITAPHVTIASAVCASSCVPGLIPPVELEEKGPDGTIRTRTDHGLGGADADAPLAQGGCAESIRMRDGSFEFDIPKHAIAQMFNVHFTLVSQVNPHILPFTYSAEGSYGMPNLWRRGRGGWRGGFLLSSLEVALKEDMLKWLRVMRSQRLGPLLFGVDWSQVFLQDNQGDVTLSPTVPLIDYWNVVSNASSRAQIERMVAEGEQITWRAMPMIESRLRIQALLDSAIDDPLLTSPSQEGALGGPRAEPAPSSRSAGADAEPPRAEAKARPEPESRLAAALVSLLPPRWR